MPISTHSGAAQPLLPFIRTTSDGEHYLAGSRCASCGEIFVGERHICPACLARDQMEAARLSETGTVYSYTIVSRSFPGVPTPFIDVTVDLDDGAHLKGTLVDVEPTVGAVTFGMPVEVNFREVAPEDEGPPRLCYVFVPARNATWGEPQ